MNLRAAGVLWMNRTALVIDTDAFNEIDDQFAIAYALSCPKTFDVRAILAAPFFNEKSTSPEDGMEKSLLEIRRMLAILDSDAPAFSGARNYLPDGGQPADSAAAEALIRLARAMPDGEKLTVAAIAAATNVASALIMAPEIAKKIRVLWLGAHARHWHVQDEFNLRQDRAAAQALFLSGAEIVWFPCAGVVSHLSLTIWEAERWLMGRSALGGALIQLLRGAGANGPGQSRVIWDIAPIAYLRDPSCARAVETDAPDVFGTRINPAAGGRRVLCVEEIDRDRVFYDFFRAVSGGAM